MALGLAISVGGVVVASSNNYEVCVKKNGVMHMIGASFKRADCKPNEQLLSIPSPAPTGTDQNSLHLFDASNNNLGELISYRPPTPSDDYAVYTVYDHEVRSLVDYQFTGQNVEQPIRIGYRPERLFFTGVGCTGTAISERAEETLIAFGSGNEARYYRRASNIEDSYTALSEGRTADGSCLDTAEPINLAGIPLEEVEMTIPHYPLQLAEI